MEQRDIDEIKERITELDLTKVYVATKSQMKIRKSYKNIGDKIKNWNFLSRRGKHNILSNDWAVVMPEELYKELSEKMGEEKFKKLLKNTERIVDEIYNFLELRESAEEDEDEEEAEKEEEGEKKEEGEE